MKNKIIKFLNSPYYAKKETFMWQFYLLKTKLWYSAFFKNIGRKSLIIKPLRFTNPENIYIRSNVIINRLTWLLTLQIDDNQPELIIDDGVTIGNFNHITCVHKVHIEKNVLTADKVYISDNLHSYKDIKIPIKDQPVLFKKEVTIGENSWIGENVSVVGCSIGKHCIIGANSVVTKDIPDYSVAVGIPARVIKMYNLQTNNWEDVREGSVN